MSMPKLEHPRIKQSATKAGVLVLLFGAVYFCFAVSAQPQDSKAKSSSAPPVVSYPGDVTFRADTQLVQVDVVVQKDGNPVDDLTQDAFTLTDDGDPKKITVFNMRRAEPVNVSEQPLPPGVVTNVRVEESKAPVSGTVILVDFMNTPVQNPGYSPAAAAFGASLMNGTPRRGAPNLISVTTAQAGGNSQLVPIAYALQQAVRFVENAQLTEPVAIFTLNRTIKELQNFTTDRDQLLKVLKKIKPEQPFDFRGGMGDYADYRRRSEALRAAFFTLSRYMKGVPGRKKLMWITYGLNMTATTGISDTRAAHDMEILPDYYNKSSIFADPIAILNDANIAVYPLDPSGLMKDLNDPTIASMNFLAGRTGGQAHYLVSQINLSQAMDRIMQDTVVTYTLGFYVPTDEKEGEHDLRVKVNRPGVEVRYRRGYTAPPTPTPLSADERFKALSAWMVEPLDATGIVMRAMAMPDADAPGVFDVSVAIDPLSLNLEPENGRFRGLIDVAIAPDTGKEPVGMHQSIEVNLEEATYLQAMQTGILVQRRINAVKKNGKLIAKDLRVAVVDGNTGKVGSLRIPIELPSEKKK